MRNARGRLTAELRSAQEPTQEQLQRFAAFLAKTYQRKVPLHWEADETLRSGFRLQVGSDIYDWSLDGRVRRQQGEHPRSQQEHQRPGEGHDPHAQGNGEIGEAAAQVLPPRADALAHQGGGRRGDAVARHVAEALHCHRQGVRCHRHRPQRGYDAGGGHMGAAQDDPLRRHGQRQPGGGAQAFRLQTPGNALHQMQRRGDRKSVV